MKLSRIASLLAGIGILAGVQVAHAADGTITFTGTITDTTCTIANAVSGNLTIDLGTVAAASFSGIGSRSPWQNFNLTLTDCPVQAGTITAHFSGPGVNGDGSLTNTAPSSAADVRVALGEANTQLMLPTSGTPASLSAGGATMPFQAAFIATAASVTAGDVLASVEFTFSYP